MAVLTITLIALTAIVSGSINRSLLNPVTSTLIIVTCISVLPVLHLYGLYEFPDIAYRIVLVGSLSILAGSMLAFVDDAVRRKRIGNTASQVPAWRISYRLVNFALLASIVAIVVTRRETISTLASGGSFAEVHNQFLGYGGSDSSSNLNGILGRSLVSPVLFACVPIFICSLVIGPRNRLFNWLFLTAMALNLLTSGGRVTLLYAGFQLMVLLKLDGRFKLRVSRSRANQLVGLLVVLVIALTLSRGNAIAYEAYTYFAIPLPLLGHWAAAADAQGLSTHGGSFLYGLITVGSNLSAAVGMPTASGLSAAVSAPQEYWVILLPNRPFNAFATMFYYFYLDFRLYGVAAFSLLFGFASELVYLRAKTSGSLRAKLVLLLVMQAVLQSFVRWAPTDGAYVLAFVFLWIVVRRPGVSQDDQSRGLAPSGSAQMQV